MREEVDVSTFLDMPGFVWDSHLGIAHKGLFPVCSRLSFFLPAWEWITLDQFVLEVVNRGYSLPFVRHPHRHFQLSRLQCKPQELWEEVSSLLTKGTV